MHLLFTFLSRVFFPFSLLSCSRHVATSEMEEPAAPESMRSRREGKSQWTTIWDPALTKSTNWLAFARLNLCSCYSSLMAESGPFKLMVYDAGAIAHHRQLNPLCCSFHF